MLKSSNPLNMGFCALSAGEFDRLVVIVKSSAIGTFCAILGNYIVTDVIVNHGVFWLNGFFFGAYFLNQFQTEENGQGKGNEGQSVQPDEMQLG